MGFISSKEIVLSEISSALSKVNEGDIDDLVEMVRTSERVFFSGVGRVKLSLEAIAKRWYHLNIETVVVGQITEPPIGKNDLLIVGSGSGESIIPLSIAKIAKSFDAKIVHIGSNENSSMNKYSDLFIRIPTSTKLKVEGEIKSKQPMTSLFDHSLLIMGDIISMQLIELDSNNKGDLRLRHANLEWFIISLHKINN